jgi:predicted acyl esterase
VIRILPTDNTFLAGHRIRLAIGTADPWVKAPAPWEQNMLGGTVTVLHGPQYPSSFYALPVGS